MRKVTDLMGTAIKEGNAVSVHLNGIFCGTIQKIVSPQVVAVRGLDVKKGEPIPVMETPGKVQVLALIDLQFTEQNPMAPCFRMYDGDQREAEEEPSKIVTAN